MEQYIGGFEIPMQYILFAEHPKRLDHLTEVFERLLLFKKFAFRQEFGQCAAIAELVDQVVVVQGPEHLDKLYYVVALDFCEDADLVRSEFRKLWS